MALPTRPTLNDGDSTVPSPLNSESIALPATPELPDAVDDPPAIGDELAIPAGNDIVVHQKSAAPSHSDFGQDWTDDGIDFSFDYTQLEKLNHEGEFDEFREDVGQEEEDEEPGRYSSYGELTADDVINTPYSRFAPLENKVERMTNIVRDILNEQGRAEEISLAREKRGAKYLEMATEIDRLVLRQLNSGQKDAIMVDTGYIKVFLAMIVNDLIGFGPVEPLWLSPDISEIMINGPEDVRIERNGVTQRTKGVRFRDADHLLNVARQMLGLMGRKIDTKNPMEDGALPDGSRINVVHQSIAPHGPLLTIRRFPDTVYSVKKMVELDSMTEDMALEVGNLIHMGCSTVIAGGTGTGKALSTATPIPTPFGMKLLGDIQVGDTVFDEKGSHALVTGYFPQDPDRECFEVVFSDGSSVIADADHNWAFFQDGEWVVMTTKQALEALPKDNAHTQKNPLQIPILPKPIEWSLARPIINPYQLGYNLGTDNSLSVPRDVTYGSANTRRAFLEGFIDAGLDTERASLHTTGLMNIQINNASTLEAMSFLINSLGDTQAVVESYENIESSLYFYLPDGVCSKLERRNDTQYQVEKNIRYIVDICPTDSVPVACISVDSPNHLYLFGKSFIATHNTSMLNALSGCIPNDDRVITIEDTPELRLNPNKHVVPMVSRPGGADGKGVIRIRDLVRNALRMRPDRIVVGEVRDSSAYDMLQAMNTGHEGSLTTVHANDARGTIERISLLVSEAGEVTADRAISLVAGGVDVLIIIDRYEDGSRRISEVHEVPSRLSTTPEGKDVLETIPLYEFVHDSTDENGKVHGYYQKVNDVSESLTRRHRLDKKRRLGLEELYEISDVSLQR